MVVDYYGSNPSVNEKLFATFCNAIVDMLANGRAKSRGGIVVNSNCYF